MDNVNCEEGDATKIGVRITSRSIKGFQSHIRLSNGERLVTRRFFPAGQDDLLCVNGDSIKVFVKNDNRWIEIGKPWNISQEVNFGGVATTLTFKEIETEKELALFEELRKFHYRGGGGAGRTVPIIATSQLWDLPTILGFLEISSSMIANSARKRFLDFPYFESGTRLWNSWDHSATKKYSNMISRISRFVIHPELRGLGLAKYFTAAARDYAATRWHYGGYQPRFLEITADMLRFYKFVDHSFASMGDTEGNEHRLSKDMTYLLKKALSDEGVKAMPQGGGGIMTLQRSYALQLMKYLGQNDRSLREVITSLKYDPSMLDQEAWEALYRLNRRPKPSYTSGLTHEAEDYVKLRRNMLAPVLPSHSDKKSDEKVWLLKDIVVRATAPIAQTAEARNLQDTFGFVGANMSSTIVKGLTFSLSPRQITLICGASGSGKTVLVNAVSWLLGESNEATGIQHAERGGLLTVTGVSNLHAKVTTLEPLGDHEIPLELKGRSTLEEFLTVTAKCGLAEPQLFVRPTASLSSGQKYRLQIALAFLKKPEVIVVDNFCETLDRYTTLAVVRGLRNLAEEFEVAVLAATASYDRLVNLFNPDQTVLLRRGDEPLVKRLSETCK